MAATDEPKPGIKATSVGVLVPPEDSAHGSGARLGFGLEKLGFAALAAPWLTVLLLALVTALATLGLGRIQVDDSLSELFRTNTPEFAKYEEIDRRFPSSEYDVLAVVVGKSLLSPAGLDAFSKAVIELQLSDGVSGR